jgi:DNA-binding GntR family transcriptional regulator
MLSSRSLPLGCFNLLDPPAGLTRTQFFVRFFVAMAAAAVLWLTGDRQLRLCVRRTVMAASARHRPAALLPGDLTELRLLVELPAVRRLASRGLSDDELALAQKLADATMRTARNGDTGGYLRADRAFHLCLLEMTADPALSQVAPVLVAGDDRCAARAEQPRELMAREAREHRELVRMVADGMVVAADHLLRLHLSRLAYGGAAAGCLAEPEPIGGGSRTWATG